MPHQSLYRRFRPQRFCEVVGQDHLVRALRNAVVQERVGHAYLLSGPRGTGKTSTARILAKALNCEQLGDDGEPCGTCVRCESVVAGNSLDLIELDAASNNSVNHIRDLTEKAALVSSGRHKVYLLDEVHMLSTAAANALLKTLEEPPGHVVFILATTDPQKVLPTIRSRTQQFELSLVSAEAMAPHVQAVADAAEIPVDEATVHYVVERGGGSVRDALSALDTVLAAGGIPDDRTDVDALVRAMAGADLAAVLTGVADAAAAGADPRDLAERTARRLRDMFLVGAGVEPHHLPVSEIETLRTLSDEMGRRANVRALETLGTALANMPQSADRRLTLETALVGLLADEVLGFDDEAAGAGGPVSATPRARRPPGSPAGPSGPAAARAALAATAPPQSRVPEQPSPPPAASPPPAQSPPVASSPVGSGPPSVAQPPPAASPPVAQAPAAVSPPAAPAPPPAASPPVTQPSSAGLAPPPVVPASAVQPSSVGSGPPPVAGEVNEGVGSAATAQVAMTAAELQGIWDIRVAERLRPVARGIFHEARVEAFENNLVSVRLSEGVPMEQARRRSNEAEAVLSDMLDRTIRVEVLEAHPTGASDSGPNSPGASSHASVAGISPPTGVPAATPTPPPSGGQPFDRPVDGPVEQRAAAGASAAGAVDASAAGAVAVDTVAVEAEQAAKVQRILDHFPGAVVVHQDDDEA